MAIAKRPVPALRSSKIMFNVNIQHIANPSSTICSVFNIEGMRKESDELAWNSWSIKVAKSTLNNWMSKISCRGKSTCKPGFPEYAASITFTTVKGSFILCKTDIHGLVKYLTSFLGLLTMSTPFHRAGGYRLGCIISLS